MVESAALLVDDILPELPIRQWVVSFPHALRFLFATRPDVMGRVLGIVYRTLAAHQGNKAGVSAGHACSGAVTLIQRFGSALNLNLHFHMLLLDGIYVSSGDRLRFHRLKAPTKAELETLVRRVSESEAGAIAEKTPPSFSASSTTSTSAQYIPKAITPTPLGRHLNGP